jgi:hypothetical protein
MGKASNFFHQPLDNRCDRLPDGGSLRGAEGGSYVV